MKKSIKQNFLFNLILKLSNLIFPLITFPIIARSLLPEGLGRVDFSFSFIQNFILIATIGIPVYALREASKLKNNIKKLTKFLHEILVINIITISISYILLFFSITYISELESYSSILFIASINILLSSLGVEWFYQALEEYKYIAIRSIIIKFISMVMIIFFVKKPDDIYIYALIAVFSSYFGSILNFVFLGKYINWKYWNHEFSFKKHIYPILMLSGLAFSISIYATLDKIMLGFISGNEAVGIYSAAQKIILLIVTLITSLNFVLLPRISFYHENGLINEVKVLIKKALDFILMISIPVVFGLFVLADNIIIIMVGEKFINSINVLKILSPTIVFVSISNLVGIQVLVSLGKENLTVFSTTIAAIINIILNFLLIPTFLFFGAAISTLFSEFLVTIIQLLFARKYLKLIFNLKATLQYLFGSIFIIIFEKFSSQLIEEILYQTIFTVIIFGIFYFSYLIFIKNEFIYTYYDKIKKRILKEIINEKKI